MIGIICAINAEVDAMLANMEMVHAKKIVYMDVYEGKISGKQVVVANSGVGKVNAAMSTTLLLSHYELEAIINVGVAGGLLEKQNPLDVVIAKNVIQHDFDTSPIDHEEGLGIISACDETLAKTFKQCVDNTTSVSWLGDIASGDVFVTLENHFTRIRTLFPTCVCAEMEAGAIAQVANAFHTPCLIIRTLSDVANKEKSAMDFIEFAKQAAHTAATLCKQLLAQL
ncbi:MAG: 5'-methylthioadenosine/adenosylhomocysteine nucleosidase [Erysipelotrichia bacterium]|nr:5'-methylthioadenosine/adenosylhomocysteine nucleosidase [Erysipelotrichia bacterium]NCC54284.1 5'-methylthioadenosine/adenosylhomocysteine nucleosidase [Erysipelotrichia bacterium]